MALFFNIRGKCIVQEINWWTYMKGKEKGEKVRNISSGCENKS